MVMRVGTETALNRNNNRGYGGEGEAGGRAGWRKRFVVMRVGIEDSAKQDGRIGFMVVRVGSEDLWENRVHGHEGGQ